ncbi:MAG: FAD-dependent oxidoreductase, partial [Deltaproteobacteria bacterium]|nr:FAD-dependent oxidoreductase [Deltaproteobacteria bacterium]
SVPVMASNRISDPDTAESLIKTGCADMVNLGRVLIADPKWPQKAFEGKKDEIRPCAACSQGCTDEVFQGRPVYCIGNPMAGFEGERKITRTDTPKRIMIVGAGPAGMEAAVRATMAGHKVEIYEKQNDIGGQLHLAGAPPHKQELLEFIRYYRAMISKYEIPLFLNTGVDIDMIQKKTPDHVIVAQGAEPLVPPIKGSDKKCVMTSWEVLKNNPPLGREVAVIGGGAVGLETAAFVASRGTITPEILYFLFKYEAETPERLRELMFKGLCRVTVFEMLEKAGKDVGKSTRWVLFDNLRKHGVTIKTSARVLEIKDGGLAWEEDGETRQAEFDTVILSSGSKSLDTLSASLRQLSIPHTVVGDSNKPGRIDGAIHGGFLAAMEL